MALRKIISGGQTGADQAALDVAINLGIPHGGWIPKGRLTEDGSLPDKYNLTEMPTASYPKRTEQNVIDSDGTVIFSYGRLTGGSGYTRKMAVKHNRRWLHVDLAKSTRFQAAQGINDWIRQNNIEVLNVAGSRASKSQEIYHAVTGILEAVCYMSHMEETPMQMMSQTAAPRSVEEAVDQLVATMGLREKHLIANMNSDDLDTLHFTFGQYTRNHFGLWGGNEELIESCRPQLGEDSFSADDYSAFILRKLWMELKKAHQLRIVE